MSIAHEFDYVKARTIKEALQLLAQPGAVPLAGGTGLVAWLRDGAVSPACLVDIKALRELRGLRVQKGQLWIGANTTFAEIIESPLGPKACSSVDGGGGYGGVGWHSQSRDDWRQYLFGGALLRQRAAVVGIRRECSCGHRARRSEDTDEEVVPWSAAHGVGQGGLVAGFSLPIGKHAGAFAKLKRYRGEDLAQASVAVRVAAGGEWRVAYGSVAPRPARSQS